MIVHTRKRRYDSSTYEWVWVRFSFDITSVRSVEEMRGQPHWCCIDFGSDTEIIEATYDDISKRMS